ncbi:MAG TPA: DUF192 domain-containing protein [Kofleriaceae bacterium]|nr:DUF192 domain-containing protein [Kofleriaceae bacterium]
MRALALVLVLAACSNGTKRDETPKPTTSSAGPTAAESEVVIETPAGPAQVRVEVVYTAPKIERGLMYREHLAPDAGMLFFMGSESDWAFYMRNTLIPLDMIFITKDMTIAGVVANAEPKTETLRRVGVPSRYVLEVNAGWAAARGVAAGAKVHFKRMPDAVKAL